MNGVILLYLVAYRYVYKSR